MKKPALCFVGSCGNDDPFFPPVLPIDFDILSDADVYQIAVMLYEFMMPDDVDARPISFQEFKEKLEGFLKE